MTQRRLDGFLQLVADRCRREAIHYLRYEADGKTTVDDLVDWMNTGGTATRGRPADRQELAIQLYHAHLPKLADHGVVDFDAENLTVRYQPDEQFESVLDSLPDEPSIPHP